MKLQETRLSLINRATRLEVSQGHQTGTIRYVTYVFILVCYRYSTSKMPLPWKPG